jgi:hypothetical protein
MFLYKNAIFKNVCSFANVRATQALALRQTFRLFEKIKRNFFSLSDKSCETRILPGTGIFVEFPLQNLKETVNFSITFIFLFGLAKIYVYNLTQKCIPILSLILQSNTTLPPPLS